MAAASETVKLKWAREDGRPRRTQWQRPPALALLRARQGSGRNKQPEQRHRQHQHQRQLHRTSSGSGPGPGTTEPSARWNIPAEVRRSGVRGARRRRQALAQPHRSVKTLPPPRLAISSLSSISQSSRIASTSPPVAYLGRPLGRPLNASKAGAEYGPCKTRQGGSLPHFPEQSPTCIHVRQRPLRFPYLYCLSPARSLDRPLRSHPTSPVSSVSSPRSGIVSPAPLRPAPAPPLRSRVRFERLPERRLRSSASASAVRPRTVPTSACDCGQHPAPSTISPPAPVNQYHRKATTAAVRRVPACAPNKQRRLPECFVLTWARPLNCT